MRVLVTGGTGLVGSHSARALIDGGHEVRLLVRAPERVAAALTPLGVRDVECVGGDVTDAASVREALAGCDAVLHAASVYRLSRRHAKEMESANPRGTEIVLGTAQELGLDPIVHVSSYSALLPARSQGPVTADAPIGQPAGPYARSKAASEAIARRMQEEGAPIVITQPGAVWGPHDPHLGESVRLALAIVRGQMPVVLPAVMAIVDVRDLAAVHAALMQPGRGPRRFLVVAEDVPFSELTAAVRRATGRRLPAVRLPSGLVRRTIGRLPRVSGALEGPWIGLQAPHHDSATTPASLGVTLRRAEESVADTLRWLYETGHIAERHAGRLAARAGDRTHDACASADRAPAA